MGLQTRSVGQIDGVRRDVVDGRPFVVTRRGNDPRGRRELEGTTRRKRRSIQDRDRRARQRRRDPRRLNCRRKRRSGGSEARLLRNANRIGAGSAPESRSVSIGWLGAFEESSANGGGAAASGGKPGAAFGAEASRAAAVFGAGSGRSRRVPTNQTEARAARPRTITRTVESLGAAAGSGGDPVQLFADRSRRACDRTSFIRRRQSLRPTRIWLLPGEHGRASRFLLFPNCVEITPKSSIQQ